MGPKQKSGGLGRSVVKARFGKERRNLDGSVFHTTTCNDGFSWAGSASITEQNDLDELMHVAQLSCTDFRAERASPMIVTHVAVLKLDMDQNVPATSKPEWIRIPRRPQWTTEMTAEELHAAEQQSFLEWRRELARLEDSNHFIVTPFERNLEVWRQLWRVVEACDLIVQILDARNPLLYYCEDLKTYMHDLSESKQMMLVVNKADFLTKDQRLKWAEYFNSAGLSFVFYSAKAAGEEIENDLCNGKDESSHSSFESETCVIDQGSVLNRDQLLAKLSEASQGKKVAMIGYPNVGKSSTINSLAGEKRVAVAATPGKTKHFQTIHLPNGVTLYDCPGLVTPNFAVSKADLVLNGVLPIDQLREWISPIDLLIKRLPRKIIEGTYGIILPLPSIDEDPNRLCTASEFLSTFAIARGFRTSFHGNPDESRAARIILKDYVNGKLLFCKPPPTCADDVEFNLQLWKDISASFSSKRQQLLLNATQKSIYSVTNDSNLDLNSGNVGFSISGMSGTSKFAQAKGSASSKKHYKQNKRK